MTPVHSEGTGTKGASFQRPELANFLANEKIKPAKEIAFTKDIVRGGTDSFLMKIIKANSSLKAYFKDNGYPHTLNGEKFKVKSTLTEIGRYKFVCLAEDETSASKNLVVIKFPKSATDAELCRKLLFEYMMQDHAHTCTYHGMCTVPKPLGFIRYDISNYIMGEKGLAYLFVSTFCPVDPGASITLDLKRALRLHSFKPILTVMEWKNICKYLIEGFESLQKNDIYHNNVRSSDVLLQFYENSVQPVIIGFSSSSREGEMNIDPSQPPPQSFYPNTGMATLTSPHVAPELFQQPHPLPTSDLYGVAHIIEEISRALGLLRTMTLMQNFRQMNPRARDGFGTLKRKTEQQLNTDMQTR